MGKDGTGAGGRVKVGSGGGEVNIDWEGAAFKLLGDMIVVADGRASERLGRDVEPPGINDGVGS